ncbi:MAG: DNA-binding protein [Chloroflexota bacterium]|nr:MAG: DNA-binding protein [Chloroflexota bacterium]
MPRIPIKPDIVYSPQEAAAALGVGRNTIMALIRRGDLPAMKPGARNWKILGADILRLWEKRQGERRED